jgi:outer membrane receptor protein involved in Fe transport
MSIFMAHRAAKAAVSLFALTLSTGYALAQDTAEQPRGIVPESNSPKSADEGEGEAIIVTGSRIRRPDFDSPNPVLTLSAQTIQQSGTTNLTDFLTGYPALVGSSTSGFNSGDNAGIGATGLNLLNLRNLGEDRTLVLIDGRRSVGGFAGTAAVDINTIPQDLIERVDVLTGGSSAIYGADAVTGVVNFVMKQNFEGLSARAQGGTSMHGDSGQRLLGLTVGKNFADGRGNIAFAYEYGAEDRLQTKDRKRFRGANRVGLYLNPDDPENVDPNYDGGPSNGIPDYVPLNDIRYFDTAREGGIDTNFDGFPDYLVSHGQVVAFDPGTYVPNFYQQGGNATSVADYGNDLLPRVRRNVFNAIGHFDVSDALTIFAEGKYARNRAFSLAQPTFDYYLPISPDNSYIPAALQDEINAAGGALINRDNFDFGQRGEDIRRETYRAVVGARGDLSDHLNYEVSYVYGKAKVRNHYVNNRIEDRYAAAIDAVDDGNGNIVCRISTDPTAGMAISFNPSECVPINLFGEGSPSAAALKFITADTVDTSSITQQVVSGSVAGDTGAFFNLPGGPVGFALGAEYRKEKSSFVPDELAAQGLTFTNSLSQDAGSFDVKEVFGEIRLPLLKDVPFAQRLEFGGAVRFSDYSSIGNTTTWKLDGSWAPVRDITFNGTYSKAVRAPNIGELYAGLSQTFQFITDPCNASAIQNGTQYRAANCTALLSSLGVADPSTYRDTRSTNLPGFVGGNPDLKPETAKTWTAGVVLQPRFVSGLTLRADWYDIRLTQAINTVAPEELAELCVDQPTLDNIFCGGITRQLGDSATADAGNIVSFVVTGQNVARFRTSGLDLNLTYRLETASLGTFTANLMSNYLHRLEFIGVPGGNVIDQAGTVNTSDDLTAPKYQVNLDLTWNIGKFTLNYGLSWFDKTLRFDKQSIASNPDIVDRKYLYYKERWQHDIFAAADVTDQFQFFAGMNNVFNQMPSIGSTRYPISAVGRYVYAGVKVKTDKLF